MKFTRLNENDIRCIVSEDELVDYGLDLDDIIEKKGRTMEFFRQLLDMAADKLGMKKKDGIQLASAQISVLKDNSISIVFHEASVEDALKMIAGEDPQKILKLKKDLEERILREAGGNGTASRQDQASGHETAVMAFMSIDDAADFCRESQYGGEVTSSFYKGKKDGFYYLFIQRSDMDIRDFSRLCFTAAEFGKVGEFTKAGKAYLLSLCDVLIGDDAYAKLRSIGK